MTPATRLAVVAAVLAVGGLLWWALRQDPPAPARAEADGAPAPAPGRAPDPPPPALSEAVPPPPPAEPEPAPDAPPRRVPAGRLPVLPGVAALRQGLRKLEIEVDATGTLWVEGCPQRMGELHALLRDAADAAREEEAPRGSVLNVVLRADRDLPWQGAQWLMQAGADPAVRAYRIHFAAVTEEGGAEGAIPAFLPLDLPSEPVTKIHVKLALDSAAPSATAADLRAHLDAKFAAVDAALVSVEIDAAPSVPTGEVLQVVAAVRAWGAKSLVFRGTQVLKDEDSLSAAVSRTPPRTGDLSITVLGERVRAR